MANPDPQPWAPGILVLGMHRSGTSCLAGMLQCIGFRTGVVDVWNLHNERGNRENIAVMGLNDALLACSGGTWNNPPPGLAHNALHRTRAMEVLDGMDAHEAPWMFKDPRTLLTLGFWRDVVPDALQIGIFRHPEAVVRSLQQRNTLATAHALELWCTYNERLCEAHEERPFPLLHFSNADGDFGERARRAIDALLEAFPDQDVFDMASLESFFAADLIHNHPGLARHLPTFEGVDDALQARAQALWIDLLGRQNPAADSLPEAEHPVDREDNDATEHDPIGALRDALSSAETLPRATPGRLDDLLDAARQQDRYSELDELLRNWLDRSAGHPLLHLTLGKSAHAQGHGEIALSYAAAAHNAAPGWVQPLEALALWSAGEGNLIQCAQATRDIQRLVRVTNTHTALFAQLFIDSGSGFTEVGSLKMPYELGDERVRLSFESGLISDRPVALRFDPVEEQLVLDLALCHAVTDDGEAVILTPASSNAQYVEDGRYYFTSGDPQLHFDLSAVGDHAVHAVKLEFDIVELGANALVALAQMLQRRGQSLAASFETTESERAALATTLEKTESERAALGTTLEKTESERAALATTLEKIESEWAGLATTLEKMESECAALTTKLDEKESERAALAITLEERESAFSQERGELVEQSEGLEGELTALKARYTALASKYEDLEAGYSALQGTLTEQLHWSESLVQDVKATDEALDSITNSVSGRLGAATSRLFMSPLTLGFGDTSLDDLNRRRSKLRDTLRQPPGGAARDAGDGDEEQA